jgi:hypothetical protein
MNMIEVPPERGLERGFAIIMISRQAQKFKIAKVAPKEMVMFLLP